MQTSEEGGKKHLQDTNFGHDSSPFDSSPRLLYFTAEPWFAGTQNMTGTHDLPRTGRNGALHNFPLVFNSQILHVCCHLQHAMHMEMHLKPSSCILTSQDEEERDWLALRKPLSCILNAGGCDIRSCKSRWKIKHWFLKHELYNDTVPPMRKLTVGFLVKWGSFQCLVSVACASKKFYVTEVILPSTSKTFLFHRLQHVFFLPALHFLLFVHKTFFKKKKKLNTLQFNWI